MELKIHLLSIDGNRIESSSTLLKRVRVNIVYNNDRGLPIDVITMRSIVSLSRKEESRSHGNKQNDIDEVGTAKGVTQLNDDETTYIKLDLPKLKSTFT